MYWAIKHEWANTHYFRRSSLQLQGIVFSCSMVSQNYKRLRRNSCIIQDPLRGLRSYGVCDKFCVKVVFILYEELPSASASAYENEMQHDEKYFTIRKRTSST